MEEKRMSRSDTVVVTRVHPEVDCGKYYAKHIAGEPFRVTASIFTHGTDSIAADLLFKRRGERQWKRCSMQPDGEDTWSASPVLDENAFYLYTVEAWIDEYSTWLSGCSRWLAAGEDVTQDVVVGADMIEEMAGGAGSDRKALLDISRTLRSLSGQQAVSFASSEHVLSLVKKRQHRKHLSRYHKVLEVFADRKLAGFSSWYELFPRSQSPDPGRHGTLRDVIDRLDYVRSMGFDVLYLTPIHPIGRTNRRGKDGGPCGPEDPGSPWAIGSEDGGHKSINRELGTESDFRELVDKAMEMGMEIALDIALQCSPDHPYVKEHPEWFYHRPDGSIRYAENPPKRYYDIYPLNFDSEEWKDLWYEMKSIFEYWIGMGIRIFRVDNPHTKPIPFWRWLINEIRAKHPDVIFLSEAFTREAVMFELAKLGFSQSYTYFTWKNFNYEIEQYFTHIMSPEITCFFRPHLFTNTPDILPFVLQNGGRAAFMMRALLAATLSPNWGIYSGYEFCENEALPGREEYRNSEKYEVKFRNIAGEGIRDFIAKLNRVRREHKALQHLGNISFHETSNPNLVMYTREGEETLLVIVNINPFQTQEMVLDMPTESFGGSEGEYSVRDLLTDEVYTWKGRRNYVRLVPGERPGHIIRVER